MRTLCERFVALVIAFAVLAVAGSAMAQSFEDALARFSADSFADTETGINGVAASGNPLAAQVIESLQDGRLVFSAEAKKVYIRTRAGAVLDAGTGQPVAGAAPADVKPVRLNNRLRRTIGAALGGLTLLAADPQKRFEAAQAVFRSKDLSALATLDTALAKETGARVRKALTEARAAVVLYAPDAVETDKLAAVAAIRDRGDQDSRGLLAGLPDNQPATVKRAAADAIAAIDHRLAMWSAAQNAW